MHLLIVLSSKMAPGLALLRHIGGSREDDDLTIIIPLMQLGFGDC